MKKQKHLAFKKSILELKNHLLSRASNDEIFICIYNIL